MDSFDWSGLDLSQLPTLPDPTQMTIDPSTFDPTSGGLNAGWNYPTTIAPPTAPSMGINWGSNTNNNWNGNADPNGGLSTAQLNALANASGSAGIGSILSRLLTGKTNASTGDILSSLLPMLAVGASGLMNRNAVNAGTAQTVAGLHDASAQATNLINGSGGTGGAAGNYTPYIQSGQSALSTLAGMGNSNIAGNFQPLGSGKALSQAPAAGRTRSNGLG